MSSAHILVVDDEPDIRGLLKEILEDEGFEVTTAENAAVTRASVCSTNWWCSTAAPVVTWAG